MTCADHPTRIMHDPSRGAELRKVPRTRPCNLACDSTSIEKQRRFHKRRSYPSSTPIAL